MEPWKDAGEPPIGQRPDRADRLRRRSAVRDARRGEDLSRILVALTLVPLLLLGACGSGNAGGDTTCGDYLTMNSSGQDEVIRTWLEDKGDADPAGGTVALNKLSAVAFCNTVGRASDPISSIDG